MPLTWLHMGLQKRLWATVTHSSPPFSGTSAALHFLGSYPWHSINQCSLNADHEAFKMFPVSAVSCSAARHQMLLKIGDGTKRRSAITTFEGPSAESRLRFILINNESPQQVVKHLLQTERSFACDSTSLRCSLEQLRRVKTTPKPLLFCIITVSINHQIYLTEVTQSSTDTLNQDFLDFYNNRVHGSHIPKETWPP